ncbi:MAG: carboxylesterase family protein [Myxococcales bacterium]|nr:carboxylesterase family protein [Myxococcales bacterium]
MGRARWVIWALGAAGVLGCGGGSGGAPKGPVCEPSAAPLASVPAGGLVQTKDGPVQGIDAGDVFTYFGIPYAEPPVGPLRWKPPVPRAPWTDTLETIAPEAPPIPLAPAIIPVPKCPQALDIAGPFASFLGPISEDCLYLNVVTPKAGKGLPVMVWIHGGGFVFGEGVQTDGGTAGNLLAAQQDVIVVSMNYRLGALGFAAHPGLSAESADGVSGNYGLMDQAAALRWVKDNIAQFGGDPNNVTVFGESAGAFSICGLMASPKAACLFDKAILESGSCERPWATLASAEAQGETLADKLGCAGPKGSDPSPAGEVACMRTKTPKELMDAWPIAGSFGVGLTAAAEDAPQWWPTLDGDFFPEQPAAAFSSGDYMQVPTLLGFNQHEGRLFVWLTEDPTVGDGVAITAENYPSFIARAADRAGGDPALTAQAEAHYALADFPAPGAALAALLTDTIFRCPGLQEAAKLAKRAPTYVYQFDYPKAAFALDGVPGLPILPHLDRDAFTGWGDGAFHSAEVQYVFGVPAPPLTSAFTPGSDGAALFHEMSGYWARFARTGDPNDTGASSDAVAWPRFDPDAPELLRLDTDTTVSGGGPIDACKFWDDKDYLNSPL